MELPLELREFRLSGFGVERFRSVFFGGFRAAKGSGPHTDKS